MIKQLNDIELKEIPKEFYPTCDYDSHRPFLWLALQLNNVGIVELGCGHGSTELLANYNGKVQKAFYSFENDKAWAKGFCSEYVKDYMTFEHYAMSGLLSLSFFIDSKPGEQRKLLIKKLSFSPLIIVHDTQPNAEYVYGMKDVLNSFKYRIDLHIPGLPSTTMVSNFVDLNYLKGKKILDYLIE